jgi:ferric-dicitrate binding protein FerR (iron transport regulator)
MESAEIFELISKADAGKLSSEEHKKLENWRNSSEENQKEFDELSKIFASSEVLVDEATEQSWQQVKFVIESKTSNKKSNTKWLWLAASFMAVSLAAYVFYSPKSSSEIAYNSGLAEIKTIVLPDGSSVQLNQNSTFTYKEIDNKRICSFDGDAYFEIAKNPEKPFIIEGTHTDIQVLGTKFLFTDRKNSDESLVKVNEGKVRFSDKLKNEKILTANEEAIFVNNQLIKKTKTENFDIKKWQQKELDFNDAFLAEVIPQIESMYNVQIECAVPGMMYCKFSGNFKNDKIETIIQVISESLNIKATKDKNSYKLEGKACDNE